MTTHSSVLAWRIPGTGEPGGLPSMVLHRVGHDWSDLAQWKEGFPGGASGKESVCQCRGCRRHGFDPVVAKIPWRREWQPAPVFLPGEFHGLAGYSPWGYKESDTTDSLLLSHFSRVQLCATPETAAHQAPPSLGFSRQKHWSGLPFPSPMQESESEVAQWCLTLSDPMDCSLTGSSIHGIFQAKVLECYKPKNKYPWVHADINIQLNKK